MRVRPNRGVMLAQHLVGIEVLWARQRFRFGDAGAKALPRDDRGDRRERILSDLARRNQGGADAGIEANLLVNRASIGSKSAGMLRLGLGEHHSDEPLEQIDGLVGQSGAELEGDRDQSSVAALPFVSGDMLSRRPARLTGKLRKAGLMDAMPAPGIEADRPDMVQALDQAEHRSGLCRLRHLAQPHEPALAGFRPAQRQRIELAPLLVGQAEGQPPLDLPPRPKAEINAEAFEAPRRRNDDLLSAAFLHDQLGQMEEPIVLKSLRMKSANEFGRGVLPKRAEPKPVLQFGSMPSASLRGEIVIDGFQPHIGLFGDKRNQRRRRPLVGSQRPPRMAQVAQHQRITEAAGIAPAASNHREIRLSQRVMANQLARVCRRLEQHGDLGLGQLLPAHRSGSPEASHRQTNRCGSGSRSACCA